MSILDADKIPQYWLDQIDHSKVHLAMTFGCLVRGWDYIDYTKNAIDNNKYETASYWGLQGSGKSTRMLQDSYLTLHPSDHRDKDRPSDDDRLYKEEWYDYEIWEEVLRSFRFKPEHVISFFKNIPRGKRRALFNWDDIVVHFPRSTYKTNIEMYEKIDSVWASIRVKVNVVYLSLPLIDRLAKNIKDNVTFEKFLGVNQVEMINRIFHLPGIKHMDSNLFKCRLKPPEKFDIYRVPRDVWDQYWDMRLELTEEALEEFESVVEPTSTEGFTSVIEASQILPLSVNTLTQYVVRGAIEGKKVGRLLYIKDEHVKILYEQTKEKKKKGD